MQLEHFEKKSALFNIHVIKFKIKEKTVFPDGFK